MTRLTPGDTAPDFTLDSTDGQLVLSQIARSSDRGVIVYFYPKASTPGCTTEACDFRDHLGRLASTGYAVVGISPDAIPALERFRDAQALTFPLASDPDHTTMEEWGAWGEKKNYGRVFTGVIRSTVVVDRELTVTHALYNVKATGHVDRVVKLLGD